MKEDEWEMWSENLTTQHFRTMLEQKAQLYEQRRFDPRDMPAEEFHLKTLQDRIYAEAFQTIAEILTLDFDELEIGIEEDE